MIVRVHDYLLPTPPPSEVTWECPQCGGVRRSAVPSLACFGITTAPHNAAAMTAADDGPADTHGLRVGTVD